MADIHMTLVQEIEKYPVLYNYKLADYSRKEVTDKAWTEVSNKINLSVSECKEKWRNIRSTFIRSFKTPKKRYKQKKPYYLKEYLSFIIPFIKPLHELQYQCNMITLAERDPFSDDTETQETQAKDGEEEQASYTANDNEQDMSQSDDSNSTVDEPTMTSDYKASRKRRYEKHNNEENFTEMVKFPKRKNYDAEETKHHVNQIQTTMNHFFLSLINEFDDMTDQQIRRFKIRTLQLIDDIKEGVQLSTHTSLVEPFQIKTDSNS